MPSNLNYSTTPKKIKTHKKNPTNQRNLSNRNKTTAKLIMITTNNNDNHSQWYTYSHCNQRAWISLTGISGRIKKRILSWVLPPSKDPHKRPHTEKFKNWLIRLWKVTPSNDDLSNTTTPTEAGISSPCPSPLSKFKGVFLLQKYFKCILERVIGLLLSVLPEKEATFKINLLPI